LLARHQKKLQVFRFFSIFIYVFRFFSIFISLPLGQQFNKKEKKEERK
jgi:Na+-transporting methylmalonyl-CoA/oxaloacetate decarboxylase gamma subunit